MSSGKLGRSIHESAFAESDRQYLELLEDVQKANQSEGLAITQMLLARLTETPNPK